MLLEQNQEGMYVNIGVLLRLIVLDYTEDSLKMAI